MLIAIVMVILRSFAVASRQYMRIVCGNIKDVKKARFSDFEIIFKLLFEIAY